MAAIRLPQRGFTLLELLVALAVLAVLASLSFRGLGSILDAEAQVDAEVRRWNDVSMLAGQLGRDLSLAVARPGRDEAGRVRAALILRSVPGEAEGELAITRLADSDSGASQSGLRRVGYRLRDRTLEYLAWPALDGTAPTASAVMSNVTDLRWRALDADGAWTAAWPPGAQTSLLPRAIEMQIVLGGGERITRLFPLR